MQRYLVPILQASSFGTETLQQIWMFLERNGTHLIALEGIEEGEAAAIQAANDFCEVNELSQASPPFCVDSFVFAPIDPTDKDLKAFYSWNETQPGTSPSCEVWRPFLWVRAPGSEELDPWGVNVLLKSICLGDTPPLNAYNVLLSYRKGFATAAASPA